MVLQLIPLYIYIYISFCFTSLYSVPANTAIYQSAVAFVFVLSVPILRERITAVKVSGNVNYKLILHVYHYPWQATVCCPNLRILCN